MTLGEKIQALRKREGLSQELLAEKLEVTRQTISKWELGQSTPDLNFMVTLSDLFGVSVDYLVREEWNGPDTVPAQTKKFHWTEKHRQTLLVILSAAALLAGGICLICDYFTEGELFWSVITLEGIAAGWLILLPLLAARTKVLVKTLAAVSIVPFPLLAVLAGLLQVPMVWKLGSCIALVSVAALWGIYGIFRVCARRWWRAAGFALLVVIPVSVCITQLIGYFLPAAQNALESNLFNSGITLLLSIGCFGMDAFQAKRSS